MTPVQVAGVCSVAAGVASLLLVVFACCVGAWAESRRADLRHRVAQRRDVTAVRDRATRAGFLQEVLK